MIGRRGIEEDGKREIGAGTRSAMRRKKNEGEIRYRREEGRRERTDEKG